MRYLLPEHPMLCLLAAVALDRIEKRLGGSSITPAS